MLLFLSQISKNLKRVPDRKSLSKLSYITFKLSYSQDSAFGTVQSKEKKLINELVRLMAGWTIAMRQKSSLLGHSVMFCISTENCVLLTYISFLLLFYST